MAVFFFLFFFSILFVAVLCTLVSDRNIEPNRAATHRSVYILYIQWYRSVFKTLCVVVVIVWLPFGAVVATINEEDHNSGVYKTVYALPTVGLCEIPNYFYSDFVCIVIPLYVQYNPIPEINIFQFSCLSVEPDFLFA